MNIKEELGKGYHRDVYLQVSSYVGSDQNKFDQLMELFFGGDNSMAQVVSNPISLCLEKHPKLLDAYYETLIHQLKYATVNTMRRNCVKFLQPVHIPDVWVGEIADICFRMLGDMKEAIAIKVFSMTVLHHIVQRFPELREELVFLLREQLPYASAGFKSRATKILKEIG